MKLTLSGSPSEIENILSRISFGNKDPTSWVSDLCLSMKEEPLLTPEQVKEIQEIPKQEIVTKVIELPPIFDTKIERITSIPKVVVPIEAEVKGRIFRQSKDNVRNVDIIFANSWILYKRFVSASAASHYFWKTNLSENLRKWYKFEYNGIWFNIKTSNNVCK